MAPYGLAADDWRAVFVIILAPQLVIRCVLLLYGIRIRMAGSIATLFFPHTLVTFVNQKYCRLDFENVLWSLKRVSGFKLCEAETKPRADNLVLLDGFDESPLLFRHVAEVRGQNLDKLLPILVSVLFFLQLGKKLLGVRTDLCIRSGGHCCLDSMPVFAIGVQGGNEGCLLLS